MADLHKIGLKMREWGFRELPLPRSPEKCTSGAYFFALLPMKGPLPAELKFRENTVAIGTIVG